VGSCWRQQTRKKCCGAFEFQTTDKFAVSSLCMVCRSFDSRVAVQCSPDGVWQILTPPPRPTTSCARPPQPTVTVHWRRKKARAISTSPSQAPRTALFPFRRKPNHHRHCHRQLASSRPTHPPTRASIFLWHTHTTVLDWLSLLFSIRFLLFFVRGGGIERRILEGRVPTRLSRHPATFFLRLSSERSCQKVQPTNQHCGWPFA